MTSSLLCSPQSVMSSGVFYRWAFYAPDGPALDQVSQLVDAGKVLCVCVCVLEMWGWGGRRSDWSTWRCFRFAAGVQIGSRLFGCSRGGRRVARSDGGNDPLTSLLPDPVTSVVEAAVERLWKTLSYWDKVGRNQSDWCIQAACRVM